MNWSTTLREADASAGAHLCSVPSRGAIKAVPDQHSRFSVFQGKFT